MNEDELMLADTTPIVAGEKPPVIGETPVVPEIDYDTLAAKMAEHMRPPAPEPRATPTDDPYEKLADLQYNDPAAYHREMVRIAREEAKKEIYTEMAPVLQPMRGYAHSQLTAGMDDLQKKGMEEFLTDTGASPEYLLGNPAMLKQARNAALGYAAERTRPAPRAERIGGGTPEEVAEDEIAILVKEYGSLGVTAEDLRRSFK